MSPDHWEEIVKPVFINNSYFAHPENLLFGLLICPRSSQEDKQKAADLILEFRIVQRRSKAKKVRKLHKPKGKELNFGAPNLFNFLHWKGLKKQKKTPPPTLNNISDDDVKGLVFSKNLDQVPKLLCHSQVGLLTILLSKIVELHFWILKKVLQSSIFELQKRNIP